MLAAARLARHPRLDPLSTLIQQLPGGHGFALASTLGIGDPEDFHQEVSDRPRRRRLVTGPIALERDLPRLPTDPHRLERRGDGEEHHHQRHDRGGDHADAVSMDESGGAVTQGVGALTGSVLMRRRSSAGLHQA
jgi:hypothetical protein